MPRFYRAMKADTDGQPLLGRSGSMLGIRSGIDVPANAGSDIVMPNEGGMSVSDEPSHLPRHRRPSIVGGTGRDPVWFIDSELIPAELTIRVDNALKGHCLIEPAQPMTLDEFEFALARSRQSWIIWRPSQPLT